MFTNLSLSFSSKHVDFWKLFKGLLQEVRRKECSTSTTYWHETFLGSLQHMFVELWSTCRVWTRSDIFLDVTSVGVLSTKFITFYTKFRKNFSLVLFQLICLFNLRLHVFSLLFCYSRFFLFKGNLKVVKTDQQMLEKLFLVLMDYISCGPLTK